MEDSDAQIVVTDSILTKMKWNCLKKAAMITNLIRATFAWETPMTLMLIAIQMQTPDSNPYSMTSREIAELTGKPHNNVLKAIRAMEPGWLKATNQEGNFSLLVDIRKLPQGGSASYPYYVLTKTQCLYIATKFNDQARAKLIIRWEELETTAQLPIARLHNPLLNGILLMETG